MIMILCAELITSAKKCAKVWERGACRVLLRRVNLWCTLFHYKDRRIIFLKGRVPGKERIRVMICVRKKW